MSSNEKSASSQDPFLAFARYERQSGTKLDANIMGACYGITYKSAWARLDKAKKQLNQELGDAPAPSAKQNNSGGGSKRKTPASTDDNAEGNTSRKAKTARGAAKNKKSAEKVDVENEGVDQDNGRMVKQEE